MTSVCSRYKLNSSVSSSATRAIMDLCACNFFIVALESYLRCGSASLQGWREERLDGAFQKIYKCAPCPTTEWHSNLYSECIM